MVPVPLLPPPDGGVRSESDRGEGTGVGFEPLFPPEPLLPGDPDPALPPVPNGLLLPDELLSDGPVPDGVVEVPLPVVPAPALPVPPAEVAPLEVPLLPAPDPPGLSDCATVRPNPNV
ncbi:MAG TPA: hypothetical protein VFH73_22535 [Polyangia bacterium]|jgi:hypothetical protein|nr:hypothetical protein [Polyangia bacterium]